MGAACTNSSAEIKNSVPLKLLVLGFSDTGKTFVVYAWSLGMSNMVKTLPTDAAMFNVEKVTAPKSGQPMYLWDIGGKMAHRRRSYFLGTQGIVYVLDASKPAQMRDVFDDLSFLVADRDLTGLPLLILANKQNTGSLSTSELESQLQEHVNLPPVWSVCGIRTFSEDDLAHALIQLEILMEKSNKAS